MSEIKEAILEYVLSVSKPNIGEFSLNNYEVAVSYASENENGQSTFFKFVLRNNQRKPVVGFNPEVSNFRYLSSSRDSNSEKGNALSSAAPTTVSASIKSKVVHQYGNMKNKLKLPSGKYLEDIMSDLCLTCNYHHPLHYFVVFDETDNIYPGFISEEDKLFIQNLNRIILPNVPPEFETAMKKYVGKKISRASV